MCRLSSHLRGKKSLVCFVTAGDPNLECLPEVIVGLEAGGADAVEVGVPFSDPIADGPIIQASSQRALDRGVRVRDVLRKVAEARRLVQLPIVLMTYYNPVLRMGLGEFASKAAASGADGVIVTDLTPEEAGPWCEAANLHGLETVFLVAPTSTDARIRAACACSTGFVYCVSRTGVTGAGAHQWGETKQLLERVRAKTDLPALVGFGVRTREDVRAVHGFADGAIIGSALVATLHEFRDAENLRQVAESFVRALRP